MTTLWDPIRCRHVSATPEERVRQKWILAMTQSLAYPKGLLAVEKSIKSLSQKQVFGDPSRRVDILCYTPGNEGLTPLLIVECKAQDEGEIPEAQVEGYNFSVGAPFLCVIQGEKAKTFWREGDKIASVPFLPKYTDLIKVL